MLTGVALASAPLSHSSLASGAIMRRVERHEKARSSPKDAPSATVSAQGGADLDSESFTKAELQAYEQAFQAPAKDTPQTLPGYKFMMKAVSGGGKCLKYHNPTDGWTDAMKAKFNLSGFVFDYVTCDTTDDKQQFYATGNHNDPPAVGLPAHNVTMWNGQILCFDDGDKVLASDEECPHKSVHLLPDANGCFRLGSEKEPNGCSREGKHNGKCVCYGPPNQPDQDMDAHTEACLCSETGIKTFGHVEYQCKVEDDARFLDHHYFPNKANCDA
jgi:hypothetical protein